MNEPALRETRVVTDDLAFPEGPVCLPDGSVLVVEIRGQTLTRVDPRTGEKTAVARFRGGPNGAAIGPDGACYVCNNGGFKWITHAGRSATAGIADDYDGGRIERVDLHSGRIETLYERVGDEPIRGPNDLVFDAHGGFYFTDMGKVRARDADRGSVCYARADGSQIREVIFPISMPNGVGLSPDGRTLYVAETETARLWAWDVCAPGELGDAPRPASPHGGRLVYNAPGYTRFDSLAVETNGNICLATLDIGAITVCAPDGTLVEQVRIPGDTHVTNLSFGGAGLTTAYITLSHAGALVETAWPRAGLALNT